MSKVYFKCELCQKYEESCKCHINYSEELPIGWHTTDLGVMCDKCFEEYKGNREHIRQYLINNKIK